MKPEHVERLQQLALSVAPAAMEAETATTSRLNGRTSYLGYWEDSNSLVMDVVRKRRPIRFASRLILSDTATVTGIELDDRDFSDSDVATLEKIFQKYVK